MYIYQSLSYVVVSCGIIARNSCAIIVNYFRCGFTSNRCMQFLRATRCWKACNYWSVLHAKNCMQQLNMKPRHYWCVISRASIQASYLLRLLLTWVREVPRCLLLLQIQHNLELLALQTGAEAFIHWSRLHSWPNSLPVHHQGMFRHVLSLSYFSITGWTSVSHYFSYSRKDLPMKWLFANCKLQILSQSLAQQSGTVSRISSGTRQSALTLSDVYWRRICLCNTSACSTLEVDNFMRYINLLTYLLTYLLTIVHRQRY